jgi:uncharacterized coiled-coil protein SlyX
MISIMHKLHCARAFQRCLPQSHLFRRRFLSSAPEDVVSINKRLTDLERQGIEHSVTLKGVSQQITAVDKKMDTLESKMDAKVERVVERFDKKFDSFQLQMSLAVSYTTFFTFIA